MKNIREFTFKINTAKCLRKNADIIYFNKSTVICFI
jgi:hypothetical protein